MEESVDLFNIIKSNMNIKDIELVNYSPLTLAYIGDAIYEIIVRTCVVAKANSQVNKLHKKTSNLVKAGTQADMIKAVLDDLTDEEISVYKRGRNAKSYTMAKNASMSEYRNATGFEALMGYLYLNGESVRMMEIINLALNKLGNEI